MSLSSELIIVQLVKRFTAFYGTRRSKNLHLTMRANFNLVLMEANNGISDNSLWGLEVCIPRKKLFIV
jgi:hypothetical protein